MFAVVVGGVVAAALAAAAGAEDGGRAFPAPRGPGSADPAARADHVGPAASLRLLAIGDVMASRDVAATLARVGAGAVLGPFASDLRTADLAFANVESIVSAEPAGKGVLLRSPLALADALGAAGVDVASVANNHALDFGLGAFLDSAKALRDRGMRTLGHGADPDGAAAPIYVEANGLVVAFIGYSRWMNPKGLTHGPAASAHISLDPKRVRKSIRAARAHADVVVVSCHWGKEFMARPLAEERHWAKLFAKAGADLILGHHPHVLQGIGREGRTVVAFSLGNFLFDLVPTRDDTYDSIVLGVTLGRDGVRALEAVPARLGADGVPAPAAGPARARIAERLSRLSVELGVTFADDGRALRATF